MRKIIIMLLCCVSSMAMAQQAKSPNGKLTLNPQDGGYVVCFEKQPVLRPFIKTEK